ncbi:MAG: RcnB family protein [Hyphomonadaceae bacterium]|nr:RcnB family protein [Hyphomonadaceae bacterium]
MKRLMTTALAALVIAGPLSVGAASAQSWRGEQSRDWRHNHDRQAQRWDQRRHNGFYLGNRFYYGQSTYQQMQRRDYRPAYQQWRRGDRLPSYARQHYREVDWRRERLREPPRGYHYVRDDRGELLLVGIATGVILGLILSQ